MIIAIIIVFVYVGTYVEFRRTHIQVSEKDGQRYVIFPEGREFLFYAFAPVEFIDSALTDMHFLFVPHS